MRIACIHTLAETQPSALCVTSCVTAHHHWWHKYYHHQCWLSTFDQFAHMWFVLAPLLQACTQTTLGTQRNPPFPCSKMSNLCPCFTNLSATAYESYVFRWMRTVLRCCGCRHSSAVHVHAESQELSSSLNQSCESAYNRRGCKLFLNRRQESMF